MKIETKYKFGDKFWVVYEHDLEVNVYLDVVEEIAVTKENEVLYFGDTCDVEVSEKDFISEDDKEGLIKKILEEWAKVEKRESES